MMEQPFITPSTSEGCDMERVLVVYSWDDWISKRRFAHMKMNAVLTARYHFDQCFALAAETDEPTAQVLVDRISAAIAKYRPTVLLLHTGAALSRAPSEFVSCFQTLKGVHPDLRFGYERRNRWSTLDSLEIFEDSSDMATIESAFFG
jgi:hypothetical protein